MIKKKADILFEVSWEVCNKVGGIYTVLSSKASLVNEIYKNNYYLIGPYFQGSLQGQFQDMPPDEELKQIFDHLGHHGIYCHYGKWLIDSSPSTILIEFSNFRDKTNDIKKELWEDYRIDSLRGAYDYDEPLAWGYAVGMLLEHLGRRFADKKIVAQFHEWLPGAGLLYLKRKGSAISTVFTTHATTLGRTMASSDRDIYTDIKSIDPDKEAYSYSVEAKHMLEKQCALNADIFTTVSEITGIEAEAFLGRKPDILLPNGLHIEKYPSLEEISIKHGIYRDRITEFMLYYFLPYYNIDVSKTLVFFTAARYEYHDKGIDIFIKALSELNRTMKKEGSDKNILALFWIPANAGSIRKELHENRARYIDIKESVDEELPEIRTELIRTLVSGNEITKEAIFRKTFLKEIAKKVLRLKQEGGPPLSTHEIYDPNDPIINAFMENNLLNKEDDKVRVIFYPIYLTGADSLLDLNYNECIIASHLGVFPSYYEPWGYTPLESGALGICSVTTNLAGYGRYLKDIKKDNEGIAVLDRLGRTEEDVIKQLTEVMHNYTKLSKDERITQKIKARHTAALADWKYLIENYIRAHNLSLKN